MSGSAVRHTVRVYRRLLGAHLRTILEYDRDFWVLVVAGVLGPGLGLVFLGVIFSQVPRLNGWLLAELVLMYALVSIADGLGALLVDGCWYLGDLVNRGELDYQLVRPYPVALQVTSHGLGIHGIGTLLAGFALLGWALPRVDVAWSAGTIAIGVVLLVSAVAVRIGITLASNSAAFWLSGPSVLFAVAVNQVSELARFPITVYGVGVRVVLTAVLPYAFVSYFPAAYLLDRDRFGWVGLLTPLAGLYCLAAGLTVFHLGLRRYESAGN